ncbi:hypothetical protein [Nocardia sp. NPDC019395]|uniref:hypothetical protein n=1 Tax=Nocardia sp. NPDC019395 TaxID=3154686 RepID=UPI0033F2FB7F
MVATAAACAAVALCPTGSGVAQAQPGFPPPIGSEIPSSMLAVDSKFEYGGETYTVTFKGGIKQRVDVNPDDPDNSVRLRTIGFKMTAESEEGGAITLEQNDVDVDARSTVTRTRQDPPRYEEKDFLDYAVTIELSGREPVELHAKVPMILTAQLTQFPARAEMFHLQEPVEFVDPGNPGTTVARLTTFEAERSSG